MQRILLALLAVMGLVSNVFAHEHHAPHQGTLVVLGQEFAHMELVVNVETGDVTAYSLDGEASNAVPLGQKAITIRVTPPSTASAFDIVLEPVENPLSGETVGNTSEFTGQSDSLRGLDKFTGVIEEITSRDQEFKDVDFDFPEGNEHEPAS